MKIQHYLDTPAINKKQSVVCVVEMNTHFCLLRECNLVARILWDTCFVKMVNELAGRPGKWVVATSSV